MVNEQMVHIISLRRLNTIGKAVNGTITIPFDPEQPQVYPTLENADFLIPAGKYRLDMSYSPKFKKPMPEIQDVPERTGIRIHKGTEPEHSTGCILTDALALENVKSFINRCNRYEEELFIEILPEPALAR